MVAENKDNKNIYIGNRYVPKHVGVWEKTKDYESLMVVFWEGSSYTSKKRVPAGIDILNEEYWALSANFNAQVENYRQDVSEAVSHINGIDEKLTTDYANTRKDFTDLSDDINERVEVTEDLTEKLDTDVEDIKSKQHNLLVSSTFEKMPYVYNRNQLYKFESNNKEKSENPSLKIVATNYEGSTGDRDFALNLTESFLPGETMRVKMRVFPNKDNAIIVIRTAYSGGLNVSLGKVNTWNDIEVDIPLTDLSRQSNYLYIDFLQTITVYIEKLEVFNVSKDLNTEKIKSFKQLNKVTDNLGKSIHNDLDSVENLINVAQTYQNVIDRFNYGNYTTAYDTDVTYQMDCSSFASLILHGVTFENSRHSGNVENLNNDLFFNDIDSYKYRYAHSMAKYFYENGYTFKPEKDFSNVQAGDLLFFNWNSSTEETKESLFMGIEHVAFYLNKNNEDDYSTLQYYPTSNTVFYPGANKTYMSQCVLVARVPFKDVTPKKRKNLLVDSFTEKAANGSIDIGFYAMNKPFEKGKYYTAVIDAEIGSGGYLILQSNNRTIFTDNRRQKAYNGKVILTFPYQLTDDTPITRIKVAIGNSVTVGKIKSFELFEGLNLNMTNISSKSEKRMFKQTFNNDLLDQSYLPNVEFVTDENKVYINLNISLTTPISNNFEIGKLEYDIVKNNKRIPAVVISEDNQLVPAAISIAKSGVVTVIVYNTVVKYKHIIANGTVFTD